MKEQSHRDILITGGAGFIGSHVIRHLVNHYPNYRITNIDCLTYAGNLENLKDVEFFDNYQFLKGDISDKTLLSDLFEEHNFDAVIHLAAESHVDRSIKDASDFLRTNIAGTVNLLDACKHSWGKDLKKKRFYHISTDEVYGSIASGKFNENSPYNPNSPYAASKAASDHFVRAYGTTYGLPILISNCSNNYGPYQFPEKLIPLCINNILKQEPIPVYGRGENIRDWLYVEDHVNAIDLVFHKGKPGETYCIGGKNEWRNIDVVSELCDLLDSLQDREKGTSRKLIDFVSDRPGHDLRYAIDSKKISSQLGWKPHTPFRKGLKETVQWYLDHSDWLANITSGSYKRYYEAMYSGRRHIKKNLK
ncbi:dTDP-glucose 4,6-dehydratase [Muriicola jejuensis]|uniref:dTDP-glucose 4,6-dehydratase n=1 Tax=Muriicola jejuensis TaxID=504488 RepID=A0A6P0U9Q7_9FLAO|nr:dTDP-glucose 4,6-dehydratase [Muriicola jejuensis]NER09914.1 dTDP-glucose 4,6-dehydratase [Muriicola jejuensis]